ncbi:MULTISPECIES: hypothetical protein, partial [Enterococcus]
GCLIEGDCGVIKHQQTMDVKRGSANEATVEQAVSCISFYFFILACIGYNYARYTTVLRFR